METFIVLGFCFILYEALDFFQGCYTNNNLHEQQHPQFSKDITSGQAKATTTAATTTQPLPTSTATLASHANENHESVPTITTIPLSDTQIDRCVGRNGDLDLIAVDSSHLNCVDSEFGTGVVEFDESANEHEINGDSHIDYSNDDDDDDIDVEDDDNSDVSSDSDIKTIQINQSSSHRNSSNSGRSRRIYSICDRVNHFNRHSELLIDYHCSSSGNK